MKPFYRLRDVEYSTNFTFFVANQIVIADCNDGYSHIFSRLEKKKFLMDRVKIDKNLDQLRLVHSRLLNGTYGAGEFVD